MSFFHNLEEKELDIIEHLIRENSRLVGIIDRLVPQKTPNKVKLVLTTIINNSNVKIMSLNLASNQKALGTLGIIDEVTQAAVTGTFTGTSVASDTPSSFTAEVDPSGNVVVTGVTAGSGILSVSSTAAYTDSTGASKSELLAASIPVTVTAVVTADKVSLVVNFGAPIAQ
jgi:hypothetical protein